MRLPARLKTIFLCFTALLLFSTLISCGSLTDGPSISVAESENRDTSCSYFYFLWGTHEEYYQRYKEALEAYQKALVCDPTGTYVERKLPILYLKMDAPDKAVDLLLANLQKTPDDISQRALLARIYIQQKNEAKAIEQYQTIISSDPENGQALLRMGILMTQSGELKEATTYFKRLLEIDRESYFARLYLARIADQLDKSSEAEEQYGAALELNYSC